MSYKVWESINTIDTYFVDDPNNSGTNISGNTLNMFFSDCNCSSDEEKIISGFIMLLNMFNDINDENIDSEKLVEYAILWLSYKLNQKKEDETIISNEFYTDYIEANSCYDKHITSDTSKNINKGVIEKKIKSMNMNIKDISNFYDPFKSLFNMYSEFGPEKNTQCKTCLESAGEFFEKYEKLKNSFDITKGYLYSKLWSSLSIDYQIFEHKYSAKCSHISPLVACPRSSVTKNILITIAIIFVTTSILLGVSYKYSLFGFRKRSQKQHLREMLKK
ncbi:PIR protein [Plasmodium yoelii]|nr:PIR protein [Plasmodium yoelii]VTZ78672.1 PIR protein [Plasmodium yoelii]|eukprot:XP_022811055.2 PIR protein [Plasmodium yoelii]